MKAFFLFLFAFAGSIAELAQGQLRGAHHHDRDFSYYPLGQSHDIYYPPYKPLHRGYEPSYGIPVYYPNGGGNGSFVDRKAKPKYIWVSDRVGELKTKEINLPANTETVFYGVTIRDGHVKVHKIIVTKVSEGFLRIRTPDGVFLTSPFTLNGGDLDSTLLTRGGVPARLLYIKQKDNKGTFFKTPDGRIGFLDFEAFDVTSLEQAEKVVDDFLKRSGGNIKAFLKQFFAENGDENSAEKKSGQLEEEELELSEEEPEFKLKDADEIPDSLPDSNQLDSTDGGRD